MLDVLASAQSYVARAADVAKAVTVANAATAKANAARSAAGLNWSAS